MPTLLGAPYFGPYFEERAGGAPAPSAAPLFGAPYFGGQFASPYFGGHRGPEAVVIPAPLAGYSVYLYAPPPGRAFSLSSVVALPPVLTSAEVGRAEVGRAIVGTL